MHNRRQRLISPVRRNVVGRLCIRPTIVFLILSNQKARVRAIISRRPFLCFLNMCYYQQRCVEKYRTQNQNKFNAYIRFRCYNNIQPPMCLHNIETPPPTPSPISRKILRKFSYF